MTITYHQALQARTFLTVAHRGASTYAPENTLEAFALALDQGVDVLELDVHLSKDDEVVVIHDDRVDRTTDGRGEVRRLALEEIRALDAGSWFDLRWRGVRVPRLVEVLERFAGRALLDIEIKAGVDSHWPPGSVTEDAELSTRTARRALEVVERAGALDRVILSSFGVAALTWVRQAFPEIPTQLSVFSQDIGHDCARVAAAGFEVISPQVYAATEANVARAHAAGLAVQIYAGPKADEAVMGRLIDIGVDAVKVNSPDRLRTLVRVRKSGLR